MTGIRSEAEAAKREIESRALFDFRPCEAEEFVSEMVRAKGWRRASSRYVKCSSVYKRWLLYPRLRKPPRTPEVDDDRVSSNIILEIGATTMTTRLQ